MIAPNLLLKEARTKAGLSQSELARRLRTTQSAIARLEAPGANPRLGTLIRAVEATGHRLDARIEERNPGIDDTLIAASLRESPADRLRGHQRTYDGVARMVAAARRGS